MHTEKSFQDLGARSVQVKKSQRCHPEELSLLYETPVIKHKCLKIVIELSVEQQVFTSSEILR